MFSEGHVGAKLGTSHLMASSSLWASLAPVDVATAHLRNRAVAAHSLDWFRCKLGLQLGTEG